MRYPARLTSRVMILGSALLPTMLVGQTTDQTAAKTNQIDQDVYLLSPFEVTADSTEGYSTTETLAGTRLRTDLRDLANSITVVNSQFLKDTGATGSTDLLVYTTNTEVGGVTGNYTGTGGGQTYNENGKLVNPSSNNRVRGLDAADNTQNYFLTEVPWDSYNVDRVEMQRGPNSILFGVGSPAGIVNSNTKQANFKNSGTVEARVGSYGSIRGSVDINRTIIDDTLAVRVIGLYKNTKYQQDPAFERDSRIYGAVRWEPKLFGPSANTSIRANFEHGDIKANRPRSLPPIDTISPWFNTGSSNGVENLNKRIIDPRDSYDYYINNPKWTTSINTTSVYPWFAGGATIGSIGFSNPAQYFNQVGGDPSTATISREGGLIDANGGLNQDGLRDGVISGIDNFNRSGIAGFNAYARQTIAGGSYYSDYSMSDSSIFDFYNNLIDGDNKREWQKWENANLSISQTFLNNRAGFEMSGYYQDYEEGQYSILNSSNYTISVDPYSYSLDGTANPYVGCPYIGGSSSGGNTQNFIDRNSGRVTGFVDLRSTDFLEESWLTRVLGHHLISALVSNDVRKTDGRSYYRWAFGRDYSDALGQSNLLSSGYRTYNWVSYIGTSLADSNYTSASGLNLSRMVGTINPGRTVAVKYFDTTWTGAATGATSWNEKTYTYERHDYTKGVTDFPGTVTTTTDYQSENPDNYVGWRTSNFTLLDSENGDIDQLYSSISKMRNTITSYGATLQSFMLDDCLVGTYGYRKDRVKTLNGSASISTETGSADPSYVLKNSTGTSHYVSGISRTWGLVLHSPDFINRVLPFGIKLSGFYGEGENFKADAPRGDVLGNQIDNPMGNTKDYGFVVSALDGRISLKMTKYETKVKNATIPGTEGTGGLNYWIWAVPNWGTTYALAALDGIQPTQYRQGGWGWPWNNIAFDGDKGENAAPTEAYKTAIFGMVKDFFTNVPIDQKFADEYGMSQSVDKMHAAGAAGNFNDVSTWNVFYESMPIYGTTVDGVYDTVSGRGASTLGDLGQTSYGSFGRLKSFSAGSTATCDTISKGYEWELTGRITNNWNVLLNVSKTKATITSVSPTVVNTIDSMTTFLAGNAGNLVLWGTDNLRSIWDSNVVRPFNTLLAKTGSSASEVAPWRFNLVSNYSFSEGMLKGVNVGGGYRWEDDRVLGYQYDSTTDALDINKPWKGGSEDHFDLWVGYEHALSDDVSWRIQLNVRNVGESAHLVPVYIQPDGTTGYSRIAEGTSWFLTNTFEF